MAKLPGPFGVLRRGIRRFFRKPSPPQSSPPPSPPPPRPPPPPSLPAGQSYAQIWRNSLPARYRREIARDTGYSQAELLQAHLDIVYQIPGFLDEDEAGRRDLFREYLRVMVAGGVTKADRDYFFHEMLGIDERDFDWQMWREVMNYNHGH